jgi:hypothetical protein
MCRQVLPVFLFYSYYYGYCYHCYYCFCCLLFLLPSLFTVLLLLLLLITTNILNRSSLLRCQDLSKESCHASYKCVRMFDWRCVLETDIATCYQIRVDEMCEASPLYESFFFFFDTYIYLLIIICILYCIFLYIIFRLPHSINQRLFF